MTKKTIPYIGEFILSEDYPAPVRASKVTVGFTTDNDVQVGATGTYALWTVPAGLIVHNVQSIVRTAFTAAVTLTIGDTDSAAGYMAALDIAATVAVATGVLKDGNALGEAYATGKQYAAGQDINIVVGGTAVLAGAMDVYLIYSMAKND